MTREQAVRARHERRLGALVLESRRCAIRIAAQVARAALDGLRKLGLGGAALVEGAAAVAGAGAG